MNEEEKVEMCDEFTPEQEAAFDRVWDAIGAEKKNTLDSLLERVK